MRNKYSTIEIVLDKIKFSLKRIIESRKILNLEALVLELEETVLKERLQTEKEILQFPISPWNFFKEKWFPTTLNSQYFLKSIEEIKYLLPFMKA